MKEGLDESLTVKGWGLPLWLGRTLSSTNTIENSDGGIRTTTRNVKRWRDGTMTRRWVAAALLEAQRGFRRLRGYKGMPVLLATVRAAEQITPIDAQEHAA